MRILVWAERYLPAYNAGAEVMLHETLKELTARGHEIRLVIERATVSEYDGLTIEQYKSSDLRDYFSNTDLLLTHHHSSTKLIREAAHARIPTAYIQHLSRDGLVSNLPRNVLLVTNSQVMYESSKYQGPKCVLYPVVDRSRYETDRGDAITLINLNTNKGGSFFWQLASSMTDRSFLGVKGAYGDQAVPPPGLSNARVEKHTPDIRSIYAQTRILLLPSQDESWGRVAIEAAVSGIPTIALATRGVIEALGGSGFVMPSRDIRLWREAIEKLDDPETYECYSRAAKSRAAELAPGPIIERFENDLVEFLSSYPR